MVLGEAPAPSPGTWYPRRPPLPRSPGPTTPGRESFRGSLGRVGGAQIPPTRDAALALARKGAAALEPAGSIPPRTGAYGSPSPPRAEPGAAPECGRNRT